MCQSVLCVSAPCVRVCACAFVSVARNNTHLHQSVNTRATMRARAQAAMAATVAAMAATVAATVATVGAAAAAIGAAGTGEAQAGRGPRACPGTDAGKMPEGRRDWIQGANGRREARRTILKDTVEGVSSTYYRGTQDALVECSQVRSAAGRGDPVGCSGSGGGPGGGRKERVLWRRKRGFWKARQGSGADASQECWGGGYGEGGHMVEESGG